MSINKYYNIHVIFIKTNFYFNESEIDPHVNGHTTNVYKNAFEIGIPIYLLSLDTTSIFLGFVLV